MKFIVKIFVILVFSILFSGCDLYPDWEDEVTYSDVFPVCGEYYVYDYQENGVDTLLDVNGDVSKPYLLYIYNKSYNPTKDSIWVDNRTGHPIGGQVDYLYRYKIKCKANLDDLTFNCSKVGNVIGSNINPLDSAVTISISESKIIDYDPNDITSSKADSIYFKFAYFDKFGNLVKTIITAGHRKTGWEDPNYDDSM